MFWLILVSFEGRTLEQFSVLHKSKCIFEQLEVVRQQDGNNIIKNRAVRGGKAPLLDTLYNDDGNPTQYYTGQWAAEYEAVKIVPADTCMLEEIVLTAYVPRGATDSVFECTLYVWNDNGGTPGDLEFQVYSEVTLNTGHWYWIYYDVSSFSRQFTGDFWVGNKKTDTNSPYNLMDRNATRGCNYWKLPPSYPDWIEETAGDYMKRAIVNYAKSDLYPYTPSGWSYPLVCSDSLDDTTATPQDTLTVMDTCYIHFAFADSNANTPYGDTIWIKLYIDETKAVLDSFYINNLQRGYYAYLKNYPLYVDTPGPHTLSFTVDTKNNVNESDENNNTYSIVYYWALPLELFKAEIQGSSLPEGNCITWYAHTTDIDCWKIYIYKNGDRRFLKMFPGGSRTYRFTHEGYTNKATYNVEAIKNGSVVWNKDVKIEKCYTSTLEGDNIFYGKILVRNSAETDFMLFDTSGRLVYSVRGAIFHYSPVREGIYILKTSSGVKKIVFFK